MVITLASGAVALILIVSFRVPKPGSPVQVAEIWLEVVLKLQDAVTPENVHWPLPIPVSELIEPVQPGGSVML